MKKLSLLFPLLLVFLSASNSFPQLDKINLVRSEKHQFQNNYKISKILYPGDSSINVTYYGLNLTLTYSPSYLNGIATINAKSTENGLTNFFLDLQDPLLVDSVFLNGSKIPFIHSLAKLNINLPQSYNYGEQFSLVIYYEGIPGSSGFGSFEFGSHDNQPAIWSLSEPYGASDWFPCKDTPADKADSSDVWVTCSNSLIAASNGTLQAVVDNGNGTHTFKWKNIYPIAQYLISIAVSDYTVYTTYYHYAPSDSMPIVFYVYPEDFNNAKPYLDKVANMIAVFSNFYGPYPFLKEKYGEAEFGWSGGMEHQTITSLGGFDDDLEAHELSHQWYGDKITCADWQDIWLNEGFASFSEAVYFGAISGTNAYNLMMTSFMNSAKNAIGSVYVQNISDVNSIFDYNRSYAKGAVVLHMLKGIMGDSLFFQLMKTYASDPKVAYGAATTADFETDAEKVYGSSLSYFFNEWIHGENYPHYSLRWNYNFISNNIYSVNLNLSQTSNTNPVFFTMPIQIEVKTSAGDTIVTILNNQQNQLISFNVKGTPQYINFDPNNLILKDISIIDSVDLTKPQTFTLYQNYPNPFNPSTTINYSIPVNSKGFIPVKLIVYDELGNIVAKLVDQAEPAGTYTVKFPPGKKHLASGVYYYQIIAGNYIQTKNMILLK
ncbi:MAG: M1 family metallopeptidase [Ignavibacteriaceae bacterium]